LEGSGSLRRASLRLGGPLGSLVATHPTRIDAYRVAFFLLACTVLISPVSAVRNATRYRRRLRTTRVAAKANA
jgi:hypothetical protein